MPNNASARHEKEKKKKDKKKKTVPPPLHKEEDKASMDSSSLSLSLSLAGKDKAIQDSAFLSQVGAAATANLSLPKQSARNPMSKGHYLAYTSSLTEAERWDLFEEVKRAHPGATTKEWVLVVFNREALEKAAQEAYDKESQDAKDVSLPPLLTGKGKVSLDRSSLLPQLTQEECHKLFHEDRRGNPEGESDQISKALLDEKPNPALETRRRRIQDAKDSSLPPPLSTGRASKAGALPLSLRAQSKENASLLEKSHSLSLTTEERDSVYAATQQENPDADHKTFILAYKVALWKADRIKRASIRAEAWMQRIFLFP
jgi:hypothetical protein